MEDNPHFLPPFANQYNRDVSKQVQLKEERQIGVASELDDQNERVRVMDEHLANVKQELVHTQALCDAKRKEIETETHLRQLAEREGGRLVQELKRIETEKADLQERLNIVQTAIFQGNERMDGFKQMMNMNQEELEQWALAAAQKEEDNLALLKYTRADEAKIKELNLNLEKLTDVLDGRKHALEREVTDTQAKQIELDKTAEDFKTLHTERQELVKQWEQTIASMALRDGNIAEAGQKYAALREQVSVLEREIAEKRRFLEKEKQNNEEVRNKITERERAASHAREVLRHHTEQVDDLEDQVVLAQTELAKATTDLEKFKVISRNETLVIEDNARRMEELEKKMSLTKERIAGEQNVVDELGKVRLCFLRTVRQSTIDVFAQVADSKENARIAELKRLKDLYEEIASMRNTIFKQSQELWKQRKEERCADDLQRSNSTLPIMIFYLLLQQPAGRDIRGRNQQEKSPGHNQ